MRPLWKEAHAQQNSAMPVNILRKDGSVMGSDVVKELCDL